MFVTMGIQQRQQAPEALKQQLAARRFYKHAKWAKRIRVAGATVFAVAGPVAVLLEPQVLPLLGAAAGAWIFISRILLQRVEDKYRNLGARAQEMFDTNVLDIEWNDALARPVAEEEIASASRHEKPEVDPWYPATDGASWPADVLICQRANAVWARRQHGRYAWFVGGAALAWALVGIGVAIGKDASLVVYLTTIALPSLPALLDAADTVREHLRASEERDLVEDSLNAHLSNGDATEATLRQIQDRLFDLRVSAPLVPEWFYRLQRSDYERDMAAAAAALSEETG